MNACRLVKISAIVVAACIACFATPADASTAFAVTATSFTMPMNGSGTSSYTVVGIPITGTLVMGCQYAGTEPTAKIPVCGGGPVVSIPVNQGQTVTGIFTFDPWGTPLPASRKMTGREGAAASVLSLAGLLLFGLGFRRGKGRGLYALLLAFSALAVLPAISACGGNNNGMTPGTYSYTITATNQPSTQVNPVAQQVATTINVTVQ